MFAHIVNPFFASEESRQRYEQNITFETMRRSRDEKTTPGDVRLVTAQFEEDHPIIPDYFDRTPDLSRSIRDIDPERFGRKLPFIGEIWQRLIDNSDEEFLIYTNADIALMPSFYDWVTDFATAGNRAFTITRRDIVNYQSKNGLPDYYASLGAPHGGWDCFVIAREIAEQMVLGDVCIGAQFIGAATVVNCCALANSFEHIGDRHLTFHLGQDKSVPNDVVKPYRLHNATEIQKILKSLDDRGILRGDAPTTTIASTVNEVVARLTADEQ